MVVLMIFKKKTNLKISKLVHDDAIIIQHNLYIV